MKKIKNKLKKFLFLTIALVIPAITFSQSRTLSISGKVVDGSNQSLIAGASVIVKGSTLETITDNKCEFILNCEVEDKLEVMFLGELTQLLLQPLFLF